VNTGICGAPNTDGHDVRCSLSAKHRGPHSATAGGPGIIGIAWCTPPEPCKGRLCAGPCHPDEPAWEQL